MFAISTFCSDPGLVADRPALKAPFAWSEAGLPETLDEAKVRASVLAKAVRHLSMWGGLESAAAWRGELTALARANPNQPELVLAYIGVTEALADAAINQRQVIHLTGGVAETLELEKLYPGNADIAVWRASTILRILRCLARVEALNLVSLLPHIRELAGQYPGHPAMAEILSQALALAIRLHSQGLTEDGEPAPSLGQILCLDLAVAEYGELAALSQAFPDDLEQVKRQAEAALQICLAYSRMGKPTETRRWLEETRKLHERHPGLEDAAFSYLYSLGATIRSLDVFIDNGEAEGLYRRAEAALAKGWENHARLRQEAVATGVDLIGHLAYQGKFEEARRVQELLEPGLEKLPADAAHLQRLAAQGNLLLAYCFTNRTQEARNTYLEMRKNPLPRSNPQAYAVILNSALGWLYYCLRLDILDYAKDVLRDMRSLIRARPAGEALDEIDLDGLDDKVRRAKELQTSLSYESPMAAIHPSPALNTFEKLTGLDCQHAQPQAAKLLQWMKSRLARGAEMVAGRDQKLLFRVASHFSGDREMAEYAVDGTLLMLARAAGTTDHLQAHRLYREARSLCADFSDDPDFQREEMSAVCLLHDFSLHNRHLERAAGLLDEARKLAGPIGSPDRERLMTLVHNQMNAHAENGALGPVWPLLEEMFCIHLGDWREWSGKRLGEAVVQLCEFCLQHRLWPEAERLLKMLVEVRLRRPGDPALGIIQDSLDGLVSRHRLFYEIETNDDRGGEETASAASQNSGMAAGLGGLEAAGEAIQPAERDGGDAAAQEANDGKKGRNSGPAAAGHGGGDAALATPQALAAAATPPAPRKRK